MPTSVSTHDVKHGPFAQASLHAVCWNATNAEASGYNTYCVAPGAEPLIKKGRETVHQYDNVSERAGIKTGALKCETSTSHGVRSSYVMRCGTIILNWNAGAASALSSPFYQLPPDLCKAWLPILTFQALAPKPSLPLRCGPCPTLPTLLPH